MTDESTFSVENEESESSQDIVELEWEEIQDVHALREELFGLQHYLSSMMIQFEKTKKNLLEKAIDMEASLYERAQELKVSKNVSEELTYELKLPNKPNEKGYLIKK